jgi:hypothetical protein
MQPYFTISFFTILVQSAYTGTASTLETRFGLSFSATTVTASRFNTAGSIEMTVFPASPDYQTFYRDAVRKFQKSAIEVDKADIRSMFEHDIQPITESLNIQLGHQPEYATVFLPAVFDTKTILAAKDAIYSNGTYGTMVAISRKAACYGYGFLEGKNLGRPISECNEDGPESLVLLFDYQKEYLYVWLMWVTFELGVYSANKEEFCRQCGEEQREVFSRDPSLRLTY